MSFPTPFDLAFYGFNANSKCLAAVAEGQVIGGLPITYVVNVPDGATADIDTVLDAAHKIRVLDVTVIKTVAAGGVSDTIQVKNGASAISNAISINVADQTVVRAGTIDDANWEILAGGTLRVTRTKVSAANTACKVIVSAIKIA